MTKIDTSGWKEFSLKSLGFDNYHGSRLNKAKRLDGEIPFLTAGKENQGLATYISNKISVYHNPITVDMFGNCFYHPFDCGGDDNVYFFVNNKLTDNTKLFIAASINAITSKKFAYVEQFRQPNADELAVALPATSSGEPDWDYMEQYMSEVMQGSEASLEALRRADSSKHKIDTSGWKEFRIGDLFDAQLSKDDIQPKSIVDGDVPLISSGKENNGVLAHIFDADAAIWDAGTLTVDMFGKAFYQPKPYHCVSHGRVNIFTPKHDISEKVGLFLASIIEKVTCNKYGFTEMCTGTKLLKEVIKLPATSSGEPDWDYMEQYMSEVMQCSKASLESLCKSIVEKECVR